MDSGTETAWQHRCLQEQPETSAFALCPPPPQLVKSWLLSAGNQADSSEEECVPTIAPARPPPSNHVSGVTRARLSEAGPISCPAGSPAVSRAGSTRWGHLSAPPIAAILFVWLQKGVSVLCPRIPPLTASPSLPLAVTPTSVSQWPSILGMGPGNSLGTFRASLSHGGRSLLLPQGCMTSTHRAERARPQSHALRSSMQVPCPGSGGTSRQSSCSRSVCSVCRRAGDCQHTLVENSPGISSPHAPLCRDPRKYPCPCREPGNAQDMPPSPCFEQAWCNHMAQLQQGQGGAGLKHPGHLQPT